MDKWAIVWWILAGAVFLTFIDDPQAFLNGVVTILGAIWEVISGILGYVGDGLKAVNDDATLGGGN